MASMSDEPSREQRERDITLSVFSISAGMVGICSIIAYAIV